MAEPSLESEPIMEVTGILPFDTPESLLEKNAKKFIEEDEPTEPIDISEFETVVEPPELSRLKCAGHHQKGNTGSNALQTEQFLVCRVTSRYNHRISDRTSIPRTKASPEIFNHIFYNTGIVVITSCSKYYYRSKLSKMLYKT